MSYCTMCGEKLADGAAYCTACGAPTAQNQQPAGETAASATQTAAPAAQSSAPAEPVYTPVQQPAQSSAPAGPVYVPVQPAAAQTPYAKTAASKRSNAALVIVLAILALIALIVGIAVWLLSAAFSGGAQSQGSAAAAVPQDTLDAYLEAVVEGEPAEAWRCCYEFAGSSMTDIREYVQSDLDDYGYTGAREQVSTDFDWFVWWYSPDSLDLTAGVEDAYVTSFSADIPADCADGDYVPCSATLCLSAGALQDYETSLYFSMARYSGSWYIVYYDEALAYDGGGAQMTEEDANYMLAGLLENAATAGDPTSVLYYFYSTIDLSYEDMETVVEDGCARYGTDEDQFGRAYVTDYLRTQGLQADDVAQSFRLIDLSLEPFDDSLEETPITAHAVIYVKFASLPAQTLTIDPELIYANGYWTIYDLI
ncbi:MAG: zinc ribbon domain-containing protein [Oscillospiraceae bacterium]|nr:zinc ribbon domain-containing protein [Oscillospiraceae bacterium]